jgi:hypothetical protein
VKLLKKEKIVKYMGRPAFQRSQPPKIESRTEKKVVDPQTAQLQKYLGLETTELL